MGALALLEVLDRDGAARHSVAVTAWPLRVGRALDNDVVLDDVHSAAHHLSLHADAQGQIVVTAGETKNGVGVGRDHLSAGQQQTLAGNDTPLLLTLGRTVLRVRLATQPLAPEQPLRITRTLAQDLSVLTWLALAVAGVLAFGTYLDTDPEPFWRTLGGLSIWTLAVVLGWCGLWTLLSKIFTRQGHFAWHLRVLLLAVLAWEAVAAGSALLAFAFSWPWVSDFGFVPSYAIVGALLYFHLQAVEPQHPRRTRALAWAAVVTGVVLNLWFNWQKSDRWGSELYMNHLFAPALRVARPVDTATFMQGVAKLQLVLDEQAKKGDMQ